MSIQRPLEGLLRPPIEWYSSIMSLIAATILYGYSDNFLLPMEVTYSGAIMLSIFSLFRFKQGYRIWHYQRNLKHMPTYAITSSQLPVSNKRLFLGKGFLWKPIHTQRLRDLDLSYNEKYRYPGKFYRFVRQLENKWEHKEKLFKYFTEFTKRDSIFNPFRPYPEIGGEPCLHAISEQEEDISINLAARTAHTVVIGTTRVGKTRLAEILISQDIHRGDVVIVLDPKGDVDLLRRICIEAETAGRKDDLLIFHLGFPKLSCRYNPIGYFTKLTQVATRITNALPSTGEAAAFKEFGWKFVNLTARGLVALGIRPTYRLISFYITKLDQLLIRYCNEVLAKIDKNYSTWVNEYIDENTKLNKNADTLSPTRSQAILAYAGYYLELQNQSDLSNLQNDLLIDLATACRLDRTYYDKIIASVGPLLEKLTSGKIAELLSPDYKDLADERPILDWLQVIRGKKIVYVGMDALTDSIISSTVGNAMLGDLVSVAGHLYNFGLDRGFEGLKEPKTPLPDIRLHSDEFNEIIGDEFIPILNKAGGSNFSVTAYTQTWSDVEARLVSIAKAGQVAGNLNSIIMFRTKEAKTVDMLIKQLPKVPIWRVTPASNSADSPHGNEGIYYQSSNEDRLTLTDVSMLEQNDVLNLPKGQAFCLLEGGKLYKIRVPLPKYKEVKEPESIEIIIEELRSQKKS